MAVDRDSAHPTARTPGPAETSSRALVAALARRDFASFTACLCPDVRLRALLPTGVREATGADRAAALFRSWFGDADDLELMETRDAAVGDRLRVSYRFRERYADGSVEVIEQDAFCDLEGGRIAAIDLVCSGHRPVPSESPNGPHQFDAGELGCGSGLPQEFRRRLAAIPVGAVLEVVARDPAAKEDLPAMARLMGHQVESVGERPDGVFVLAVRRRR